MKIGVIGGVAAGKVRESITVGFNSTELEWVCEYEKPTAPVIYSAGFQRVIARPGLAEFDKYKLMILERDEVLKLFYVLEGIYEEELNLQLNHYWDRSDPLGYHY